MSCVAVMAYTVVMEPSTMPNFSCTTFVRGAKEFVVHDAFEAMVCVARHSL